MINRVRKWKAQRLINRGWQPHELIERRRIKLSHKELTDLYRLRRDEIKQEEFEILQEKVESLDSPNMPMPMPDAPSFFTIDENSSEEPTPNPYLHLPEFIERGTFYDQNVTKILEELAEERGISYNFFKERFLVGDGCCWICGGRIKSKNHFFCPWHNVDAKENIQKEKTLDIRRIAEWSLDHEDFQLPLHYLCPKCEDRPQMPGSYLCAYCRGLA